MVLSGFEWLLPEWITYSKPLETNTFLVVLSGFEWF